MSSHNVRTEMEEIGNMKSSVRYYTKGVDQGKCSGLHGVPMRCVPAMCSNNWDLLLLYFMISFTDSIKLKIFR